jgi:hypothetical protein
MCTQCYMSDLGGQADTVQLNQLGPVLGDGVVLRPPHKAWADFSEPGVEVQRTTGVAKRLRESGKNSSEFRQARSFGWGS